MAWPTKIIGALLIAIGVYAYLNSTPNEKGELPKTSLIPAFFGAILVICGALSHNPKLRKHVMHVAAMVGVLGAIGGFMPLIRQASKGLELDPTKLAAASGLLMSALCALFVFLCVRSFIAAKKARLAAIPS